MTRIDLRDEARKHMPALPALTGLYPSARSTWRGRMINEHTSARVFEGLALQLAQCGFSDVRQEECRGFADEERRHGVLCGAVVEALGGEAIFDGPADARFPMHRGVAPLEGLLRNLMSISCMSETVAVSLISAERIEMPEGELRTLLEKILADEIGHARFGWKLVNEIVPTLDRPTRERLGEYLVVALAHLEQHELTHINEKANPPREGVALGLCNGADARGLFYDTVQEVILPQLEQIGLPAQLAWARRAS